MTSPYSAAVPTPADPIEDRRKELIVYYQFCYPVEKLFYKTLWARYPEMTVMDIAVCRAQYISDTTGGLGPEERRGLWNFATIPQEEWPRFLLENTALLLPPNKTCRTIEEAQKIIRDRIETEGFEEVYRETVLFPTEHSFENAIGLCYMRGYLADIPYTAYLERLPPPINRRVNQEIQNLLDDALAQAVKTQDYVTDEQVFQHEREQAELDRRHSQRLS